MPTLTPHSDMEPSPRVIVLFEDAELDPAIDTITVFQISSAGQVEVRDAIGRPAAGGFTVTDYEVPPGIEVTYQAQQYDVDGAVLGLTAAAATQVDFDPGYVVIQDPLAPRNAILVDAHTSFADDVITNRSVKLYRAGFDTVALSSEMSLLVDVPLRVSTRSLADADTLRTIVNESPTLVRTMPNVVRVPACLYVVIPAPRQIPIDVQYGGEWVQWELTAQELTRPLLDTLVPAFTYGDYKTFFDGQTYGDSDLVYTTYLDSKLNPPPVA